MNLFDEIIKKAEKEENDLYFKKKKERYFKIHRRDTTRLYLKCKNQPKSCSYSIRCYNQKVIVNSFEENCNIHSCNLQYLSKKVTAAAICDNKGDVMDYSSSQNSSRSVPAAAAVCNDNKGAPTRNSMSFPVVCKNGNVMDYQSRKENALLDKETSSTPDDYVFSTSQDNSSSQNSSRSVPAAAAVCNDNKGAPTRNSLSVDDPRISMLMGVFDTLELSTEEKLHMASSLRYLLHHQFGLPFVNRLFCEYEKTHRDKMILDLQLIRSLRFPEKYPTTYIQPRNMPIDDLPNFRKRKYEKEYNEDDSDCDKEFDWDDGDTVIYVDKPHKLI